MSAAASNRGDSVGERWYINSFLLDVGSREFYSILGISLFGLRVPYTFYPRYLCLKGFGGKATLGTGAHDLARK